MRPSLTTIVNSSTTWRLLVAVLVIAARFALDELMPRGWRFPSSRRSNR
jgi:hypothetical protein